MEKLDEKTTPSSIEESGQNNTKNNNWVKPVFIGGLVLFALLAAYCISGLKEDTGDVNAGKDSEIITSETIGTEPYEPEQYEAVKDVVSLLVSYESEKETYISFATNEGIYQPLKIDAENMTILHVLNGREDVKSIYVKVTNAQGEIVAEKNFTDTQEYWWMAFDTGVEESYDVSFTITDAEGMEFYVSTEKEFLLVTADAKVKNQSVYMITDMEITEDEGEWLEFTYPFTWDMGDNRFITNKNIRFDSDDAGEMYIYNADVSKLQTGRIVCDTPAWDYQITHLTEGFEEEHYYYIKAHSVNGKEIDITSLYVDNEEKLQGILQKGESEDRTVLNIPEEVEFLTIVGDYELGRIATDRNLTLEVAEDTEAVFEGKNLKLIWKGDSAPSYKEVQKYMYVKSYNGKAMDSEIGGMSEAVLLSGGVKLSSKRTNSFVIDGNYIQVYTGYADSIAPQKAEFSYKLSGEGSAKVIKQDGKYYCVVTDQNGEKRNYPIEFIEKEYNLPIVSIETENQTAITSKEEKIPGTFSIDYNGTENYENIDSCVMDIKGRGNSSWKLDKKPYKIKFEEKVSLFGLTEAKEWVLQANHADKSLIRNKLAMDMGNILDQVAFTPHSYNVDVFVNGEYMGVYTLTEQIEVKDGRIPGEKDSTEIDTDYLLELGGDKEETSFGTNMFHAYLMYYVEVKNPDSDVLSLEQYAYIKEYARKADQAIMNLEGYEDYIDVPSAIDWFILNEFSYNVDGTFRRSDYLLKKKGGKLYMATYWDYDYAFGNFWRDSADFDEWICLGNENTENYIINNWFTYLLQDPEFVAQLKTRWEEVGKKLYQTAMNTIKEADKNVSASAEENFARWPGILGKKIQYEFSKTASIKTYDGQLDYLKKYIEKRYKWMDKTIKAM